MADNIKFQNVNRASLCSVSSFERNSGRVKHKYVSFIAISLVLDMEVTSYGLIPVF